MESARIYRDNCNNLLPEIEMNWSTVRATSYLRVLLVVYIVVDRSILHRYLKHSYPRIYIDVTLFPFRAYIQSQASCCYVRSNPTSQTHPALSAHILLLTINTERSNLNYSNGTFPACRPSLYVGYIELVLRTNSSAWCGVTSSTEWHFRWCVKHLSENKALFLRFCFVFESFTGSSSSVAFTCIMSVLYLSGPPASPINFYKMQASIDMDTKLVYLLHAVYRSLVAYLTT